MLDGGWPVAEGVLGQRNRCLLLYVFSARLDIGGVGEQLEQR